MSRLTARTPAPASGPETRVEGFNPYLRHDGWHISNGLIDYGPYSSRESADASAAMLTRQLAEQYARRRGMPVEHRKAS